MVKVASQEQGNICNIQIEDGNICNTQPRPANSNGLVIVKLKLDLKFYGNIHFEPERPSKTYSALRYITSQSQFYEDV